jgi:hypothetical protein
MRGWASLAAGLLVLASAAPALACINDREVNKSEREFKSTYNGDTPRGEPVPGYTPPAEDKGERIALLGGGSVLLLGACAVCLRKTARPS